MLTKCSECGKDVSDKAASCPNCGNPINNVSNKEDEYIVCPKCHSKELHANNKGFSGGKALTVAILTGGIGLLAGTIGSKDILITCLKCGNKFKAGEGLIISNNSKSNIDSELIAIIKTGNMLNAVMRYRGHANCELSEAKRYVDNLALKEGIVHSNNSGCAGSFILILLIVSIIGFTIAF